MTTRGNARSPTLAELLRTAVDAGLEEVHVAIPGSITEWDEKTQKASVKPLVQRRIAAEDGEEIVDVLPVITDVPVMFPRSADFFVSFPLKVGDFVLLIFAERSLDKWLSGDGKDTDPQDFRRHDMTDAIAIPGCAPFSKALKSVDKDDMVLAHDSGVRIHLKTDGTIHLGSKNAADALALASKVEGEIDALRNTFNSHIHTTTATIGPSAVPGVITPPTSPHPPVNPVGSDVVKAD